MIRRGNGPKAMRSQHRPTSFARPEVRLQSATSDRVPVPNSRASLTSAPSEIVNDDSSAGSTDVSRCVVGTATNAAQCPQGGKPISNTGLFMFKNGGNEETYRHYESIRSYLYNLVQREVTEKALDPVGSMVIRPRVIGKSREDACYWIVVYGLPKLEPIINSFFKLEDVARILIPPARADIPALPFIFIPQSPTLPSRLLDIVVRGQDSRNICKSTYCGSSIEMRKNASPGTVRSSTFGGIIKVSYAHGRSELYGLTAGHVVQDLEKDMAANTKRPSKSDFADATESTNCANSHYSNDLGRIVDATTLPGVLAGRAKPSHDWSLFTINRPRPNKALGPRTSLNIAEHDITSHEHDILVAEVPAFYDGISDQVLLLGGVGGSRSGELSNHLAGVWVEQSEGFVDAYPLEMDGSTVNNGDSGAWVVHHNASELYGHVVATDSSGDAYVLPALDTLENIRKCTGATIVTLPGLDDITGMRRAHIEMPGTNGTIDPRHDLVPPPQNTIETDRHTLLQPQSENSTTSHKTSYDMSKHSWPAERFEHQRQLTGSISSDESCADFSDSNKDENTLKALLRSNLSTDSTIVDEIADFCSPASGHDLDHTRRTASLDDREERSKRSRYYPRYLTASELYQHLRQERFGHPELPDADRRLIYISNLTPAYAMALIKATPHAGVGILGNAIWRHIASQHVLETKIEGNLVQQFQMSLHLPFLSLRMKDNSRRSVHALHAANKTKRKWVDVSFLHSPQPKVNSSYGIREAQISIVLCGTDESSWMAYTFVDTGFGGVDDDDDDDDDGDDDEDPIEESHMELNSLADEDCGTVLGPIDPIAGDPGSNGINTNATIDDPREYFLRIVSARLKEVTREWTYIVREVERFIEIRTKNFSRTKPHSHIMSKEKEFIVEEYLCLTKTNALLAKLRMRFDLTSKAWENFNRGDIRYFTEPPCVSFDIGELRDSFNAMYMTAAKLNGLDIFVHKVAKVYKASIYDHNCQLLAEPRMKGTEYHPLLLQSGSSRHEKQNQIAETNGFLRAILETSRTNHTGDDFVASCTLSFSIFFVLILFIKPAEDFQHKGVIFWELVVVSMVIILLHVVLQSSLLEGLVRNHGLKKLAKSWIER